MVFAMLPYPFNGISKKAISNISLAKGENLFLQGDKTAGIFFLESGTIILSRHTASGDRVIVHNVINGEIFAEASLFSSSYHCDADAGTASTVIKIARDQVMEKFNADLEFATALASRFAVQIQDYRRRVEILGIRNAKVRVYEAFCDGLLKGGIKTFAEQIGLTHEATYRSLAALVREGRIRKIDRGKYMIKNDPEFGK